MGERMGRLAFLLATALLAVAARGASGDPCRVGALYEPRLSGPLPGSVSIAPEVSPGPSVCADLVGRWPFGPTYNVTIAGGRAYYQSGTVLVVADISDPAHPTKLGEFVTPGGVGKPAVSGSTVYLPNNWGGFRILDASDPASITVIGELPAGLWADQIVLSGAYAFLGSGASLLTVRVSDPASPEVKASFDLPAGIESLLLSGNRLYVADNAGGLQILDVSNPLAVSTLSSTSLPQSAKGVSVSGNYAYVAADTAGLYIFDITDPTHPTQAGALDSNSYPYGIEVVPPYAFIADHWGLWVVDVSDPSHPVDKVRVVTPGSAWDLALSGNYAYIADYSDGIRVMDISDPLAPVSVGSAPGWDWGDSVALNGRYAYVADDYQGLLTFDVLSPTSPTLSFHNPPPSDMGMFQHVVLQGTTACVSASNDGFILYSLSNPAQPQLAGQLTGLYATESAVSGNFAYVTASSNGFVVVDISDPAHPAKVGALDTPGNATGVTLSGNYAFVADGSGGLAVINISDRAHPVLVSTLPTSYQAVGAFSLGDLIYLGSWNNGLHVIDVFNLSAPVEIASLPIGSPQHFTLAGNRMFVGTRGTVVILDVTDPRNPIVIGEFDTPGFAFDAVASGDLVYIADGMEALAVLELKGCEPVCTVTCDPYAAPASGPAPLAVTFSARADMKDCSGAPSFLWNFGDGTSSTDENPSHTFASAGQYAWTFTVSADGSSCSGSGTVGAYGTSGSVTGAAGILSDGAFYPLASASVTGTATLRDGSGATVAQAPLQQGSFTLSSIPNGTYTLQVALSYTDHIAYDAALLEFGCPAPAGHDLTKTVISAPVEVSVQGAATPVQVAFAPPLVFLHGALECYGTWAASGGWDEAARAAGHLSFTPNFAWWGPSFSWGAATDEVASQVLQDLQGLCGAPSPLPPWTLVARDMGGLVARALTCGPHRAAAPVLQLGRIVLLATPNSGSDLLLGGGSNSLLSANSVVRRFNEVYPDFGDKSSSVYAIGGDAGWWGSSTADGPLAVPSAFTVGRLACAGESCVPYAHLALDSGAGHLFGYGHESLGGPASTLEILDGIILPAAGAGHRGIPESPAGGLIWGTGARTAGTAQGSVQSRSSSQDFPFSIGPTDGMAIAAWVTSGSASFQVLDPSLTPSASDPVPDGYPGFLFLRSNPAPGTWTLRLSPGPSGASFSATAVEDSPFGLAGHLLRSAHYPLEMAEVIASVDGSSEGVTVNQISATLFGLDGTILAIAPLTPSGAGYAGALSAPGAPGSYPVTFTASGTYQDQPVVRTAYERLNVIPTPTSRSRLFSGTFSDHAEDRDASGKYDTVVLDAAVALPAAGSYALAADLYDASGHWLARASTTVVAQSPGAVTASLAFAPAALKCSQLPGAFEVRNLMAIDGTDLAPLDLWAAAIATQTYAAGSFDCAAGTPLPALRSLRPDQGIRGRSAALTLSGDNLRAGAQVSLGPGITIDSASLFAEGVYTLSVSVLPDAVPGSRTLTFTNPGSTAVTLPRAFEVKAASVPEVAVTSPGSGRTVKGTVTVTASARGDLPVTRVDFSLDGSPLGSDSDFPFQIAWESGSAGDGPHLLRATATDLAGQQATSEPVAVTVCGNPVPGDCDCSGLVSIGEVQKAINMFLGITPPGCAVDCNGDGVVSIGEVQKVINGFLGLPTSC